MKFNKKKAIYTGSKKGMLFFLLFFVATSFVFAEEDISQKRGVMYINGVPLEDKKKSKKIIRNQDFTDRISISVAKENIEPQPVIIGNEQEIFQEENLVNNQEISGYEKELDSALLQYLQPQNSASELGIDKLAVAKGVQKDITIDSENIFEVIVRIIKDILHKIFNIESTLNQILERIEILESNNVDNTEIKTDIEEENIGDSSDSELTSEEIIENILEEEEDSAETESVVEEDIEEVVEEVVVDESNLVAEEVVVEEESSVEAETVAEEEVVVEEEEGVIEENEPVVEEVIEEVVEDEVPVETETVVEEVVAKEVTEEVNEEETV